MTHPTSTTVVVLASGSAGNALFIESDGHRLLIDVGLSAEAVERALGEIGVHPAALSAIILTHEHDDHARGAGPLSRAFGIPLMANAATAAAARAALSGAALTTFDTDRPFEVGSLTVTAFRVSHDAAEPVGFTVQTGAHRITIATDLGSADEALDPYLAASDLIVLESNYDLRLLNVSAYPWFLKNRILSARGHLSNDDAARVLARTAADHARTVCLAHLSEVNNLAALARDTVLEALARAGAGADRVLAVPPNGRSRPIVL